MKSRAAWLPPLLAFLVPLAAFSPALRNGFVNWDDGSLLAANERFRGLTWENLGWMFGKLGFGSYAPLSWLTLAWDYALWGMDPRGYHLTAALIHCANAALFYAVSRRLLALSLPDAPRRWLPAAAAFSALLFAVHPLRVESVAWAAQRRDVVSGFFYLLALHLYVRPDPAARGRPGAWAAFLLALLSKGTVVALPFVLLVLDLYPLRRLPPDPGLWATKRFRPILVEKAVFLIPALAGAVLGFIGQSQFGEIPRYAATPLSARLAQTAYSLVFYAGKTAAPWGLTPIYPRPKLLALQSPPFALSLLAVLGATAALWAARRRWPAGLAAWACYAATLAPAAGLVPFGPQIVADRYSYLPCLAFAALAGGGLLALLKRAQAPKALWPAGALVLALAALTWRQASAWRDDEALWSRSVAADPGNQIVRNFLGNVRAHQGRTEEAAALFTEAIALDPDYAAARNNLGNMLARQGRWEEAAFQYAEAARLMPDHPAVHFNWGLALLRLGRRKEAAAQFRRELEVGPDRPETRAALAEATRPPGKP